LDERWIVSGGNGLSPGLEQGSAILVWSDEARFHLNRNVIGGTKQSQTIQGEQDSVELA